MSDFNAPDLQHTYSIEAEQAVLGALLADNNSLDRIGRLEEIHFFRHEHRLIYAETMRQIMSGRMVDAVTVNEKLSAKVTDCMQYLIQLHQSALTGHRIRQHADIVVDRAHKRELVALGMEIQALGYSQQDAASCIDMAASKLDMLATDDVEQEPQRMSDMMVDYLQVVQDRHDGKIMPISTGHADLDAQLDGGLERGTVTVVAGRPSMGKTAFGLGIARNVAAAGDVSLFLSMEMSRHQVNDRNVSAIGHIPLKWLRRGGTQAAHGTLDREHWESVTRAVTKAQSMSLFIDDQTGLNMLAIRAKARKVKRKAGGLGVLVIDQLSFITGGSGEKTHEVVGEYTRALVAMAKELDTAVLLLCQLNRKCEDRNNKRPVLSDLAVSGSIEQDAANVIFLYRDEVYNENSPDRGICELILPKVRQGEPGTVALAYIGQQTRFEDLAKRWVPGRAAAMQPNVGGFE